MFEVTFLGTGATVPTAARGLSALMVEHRRARLLVDCGEGTLRQIRRAGLGLRRIDHVLLTHGHLDHVLGLAGLAGTLDLWGQAAGLCVHGGPATLAIVRTLLDGVVWPDGSPHLPIDLRPPGEGGLVLEQDGLRVSAFPVRHGTTDSLGYRFEEVGHRPLDLARLEELGVPEGAARMGLAAGQDVVLPNGRRVAPGDVLGPLERGAVLVVVGDVGDTAGLEAWITGADLLVIEATYRTADLALARAHGHLTVADACALGNRAGVRQLVLTHQSDRYDPADVAAEAAALFPRVTIARDFDRMLVQAE